MRISLLTFFLCCLFFQSQAQLTTAKLFADHMVLQRNKPVPIWGWTAKGAKVTVIVNGQKNSAKADEAGYWKVLLKPMEAGGPYSMTIVSGKDQLVYNDVMLGEVWLCSGQSNMEFQLKNAFGYKAEQKIAPQMTIRQFTVPKKMSLEPDKDIASGSWAKADTNTIGDFTAVGYFFAKQLSQQLHVTVGLIYSNWGGTAVEDWISKETMSASPEMGAVAKTIPTTWDGVKGRVDKQLRDFYYGKNPQINYTVEQLATQPTTFFEAWPKGTAGPWEWQGKTYSYRGQGFMQRTIKLDSSYSKRNSVLHLGQTDADLVMYINGKLIPKETTPGNFLLNLSAGTWKGGDNSLLIDIQSAQKNPAWWGIGINGDAFNTFMSFPDTVINLADNNWRVMPDLGKPYHYDYQPNNTAFSLYNAMIYPLVPYAMAGVIWYQGETNAGRAYQYRTSFPMMISDWRERWKEQFPFLFVQLSSFGPTMDSNKGSEWAELREAQTLTLQMPNTGMAVTTDIGDAFNIHPKDKADVGFRLAAKALTAVYHQSGFTESPRFATADFTGGNAIVNFSHADNGLVVKDKYGYIKGFELAGADHKFYYAQAVITDGNKIKVWCPQVPQPVAVRYAWADAPIDANLFNKEGFPVSSFRSDTWPGVTDKNKFE